MVFGEIVYSQKYPQNTLQNLPHNPQGVRFPRCGTNLRCSHVAPQSVGSFKGLALSVGWGKPTVRTSTVAQYLRIRMVFACNGKVSGELKSVQMLALGHQLSFHSLYLLGLAKTYNLGLS